MGKRTFMNGAYSRRGGRRQGGGRGGGIAGGEQRPPLFGDLLMWFDAQDAGSYTITGQGLSSWVDKIAGVDCVQSSNTLRPVKQPANQYFKGRDSFRFGTGQKIIATDAANFPTAAIATGDYTYVTAHRKVGGVGDAYIVQAATENVGTPAVRMGCLHRSSNVLRLESIGSSPVDSGSGAVTQGAFQVAGWSSQSVGNGSAYSREFGREEGGPVAPLAGIDTISIGNRGFGGNNADTIELAEVLVYDHALTDLEWIAVQSYLDGRYRPATVPLQEGVAHWWDPTVNDNISIDSGRVDAYTDRVGGVVLSQGTPSTRPTVELSERLGHQAMRFDGTQFLDNIALGGAPITTMFEGQSDFTTFAQYAKDPVAGTHMLFAAFLVASPATDNFLLRHVTTDLRGNIAYSGGGVSRGASSGANSSPRLAANWMMGGVSGADIHVSSRTAATPLTNTITTADMVVCDSISIGSRRGTQSFEGVIGHVMLFNYALTTAQRARVEAYLEAQSAVVEAPLRLGAVAHFDPTRSDLITIEAGAVAAYEDKIGGFIVSQSAPSQRPSLVQSSIRTGHQMLSFSAAASQELEATSALAAVFNAPNDFDIFTEVSAAAGGGFKAVFGAWETEDRVDVGRSPNARLRYSDGLNQSRDDAAVPDFAARWIRGGRNGANLEARVTGSGGSAGAATVTPTALTDVGIGATRSLNNWDGEIGQVLIFAHSLNALDEAAVIDFIESGWANAEVPLRLGADLYIDAEDALGNGTWPSRDPGADFTAAGTEAFGTMNGRRTAVFGDQSYTRTDPSADTSRGDHTMAIVMDQVSAGADREYLNHFEGAGDGSDNRVGYGHTSTDVTSYGRQDTSQTRNTFATFPNNTTGERNILILTFDDASNVANVHFNGDDSPDTRSNSKVLATVQDTTRIGGRQGGGFEHRGGIAMIAQFGHVMNDNDRGVLEDFLFARYFDWAAAENTPGAIDDLAVRFDAADLSGENWPSVEGSLHPVTMIAPSAPAAPPLGTAPEVGNRPVAVFDGTREMEADLGVVSLFDDAWSFLAVAVRRNLNWGVLLRLSSDSGIVSSEAIRLQWFGSTVLAEVVAAGIVSMATTEEVVANQAGVVVVACDNTGVDATVMVNGVLQSFAGTAQAPTTLRYLGMGFRSDGSQPHAGDVAELRAVSRRLGRAELIAWAAYADQRYLDPSLI